MQLHQLYKLKLLDYRLNGIREQPAKLLAMLLLPEKDMFESTISEKEFYETYKIEIDGKIKKVMADFNISDEDIINDIEEQGFCCTDLEEDKIWSIFCEGFRVVYWSILHPGKKSPEEIYSEYFSNHDLKVLNETMIQHRKLYNACKEYSEVSLPLNPPSFHIEKHWQTIAEDGFIEKYCLSEEELERLQEFRKVIKK